jgi:hypothetical protein
MPAPFTLAADGDGLEQQCKTFFLDQHFPNYEEFWIKEVVVVTNRDQISPNIHFKNDAELANVQKNIHSIVFAQLHYTILRHLARAYSLNQILYPPIDIFQESMAHISSVSDIADELLERFSKHKSNQYPYDPWNEKHGSNARRAWRGGPNAPLQNIRDYRNRLVHGRMLPFALRQVAPGKQEVLVPKIGQESAYQDWRVVTQANWGTLVTDLEGAQPVAIAAWNEVVKYCNDQWALHLL